jgi:hypothetical protein
MATPATVGGIGLSMFNAIEVEIYADFGLWSL